MQAVELQIGAATVLDDADDGSLHSHASQGTNNRSGLVRAVVKDYNDVDNSSTLDSDGGYNVDTAWGANAAFNNVSNGAWHMVTLTTRTDVHYGYLLYIDGELTGKVAFFYLCIATDVSPLLLGWLHSVE